MHRQSTIIINIYRINYWMFCCSNCVIISRLTLEFLYNFSNFKLFSILYHSYFRLHFQITFAFAHVIIASQQVNARNAIFMQPFIINIMRVMSSYSVMPFIGSLIIQTKIQYHLMLANESTIHCTFSYLKLLRNVVTFHYSYVKFFNLKQDLIPQDHKQFLGIRTV